MGIPLFDGTFVLAVSLVPAKELRSKLAGRVQGRADTEVARPSAGRLAATEAAAREM